MNRIISRQWYDFFVMVQKLIFYCWRVFGQSKLTPNLAVNLTHVVLT